MPALSISFGEEWPASFTNPFGTVTSLSTSEGETAIVHDTAYTDPAPTYSASGSVSWDGDQFAPLNLDFAVSFVTPSTTSTDYLSNYNLEGNITWDLYTTTKSSSSFNNGNTSSYSYSTKSTSSSSNSLETFTVVTSNSTFELFSGANEPTSTRASNYKLCGTFTECVGTHSVGTISELDYSSSLLTTKTTSFPSYYVVTVPSDSDFNVEGGYIEESETTVTISSLGYKPIYFGGYVTVGIDFVGTTYGISDYPFLVYDLSDTFGQSINPAIPLCSSIHPEVLNVVSFTEFTTGRFGNGESYTFKISDSSILIYSTTDFATNGTGTEWKTSAMTLSVDSTAASSQATTLDSSQQKWTLSGGQEWTASLVAGQNCRLGITSNFSDSTTSETFSVGSTFSSTFSITDGANIVIGPFLYNPPTTYSTDTVAYTTTSGEFAGTYYLC